MAEAGSFGNGMSWPKLAASATGGGDSMTRIAPSTHEPLVPRTKVWIECGGEYVFGHGICVILEAVAETGNIKQAAERIQKSYRYVWSRIREAERALGESLVEARVGGADAHRSSLTPLAVQLIAQYRALRSRMIEVMQQEFPRCFTPP